MALLTLSYNIWFSDAKMDVRMRAIADIVAARRPDVVALQEVTAAHWKLLSSHEVWAEFTWSSCPEDSRYYTMLGCRTDAVVLPERLQFRRSPFPRSGMGRDLLSVCVTKIGAPAIVIGTSHLESLNQGPTRHAQLALSVDWLQERAAAEIGPVADILFCGDTNFMPSDGAPRLPIGWVDAASALHAANAEATFDVQRNEMVARMDAWAKVNHARVRFDRMFVQPRDWALSAFELVGTDAIASSSGWWPSDQFGVLLCMVASSAPVGMKAPARKLFSPPGNE